MMRENNALYCKGVAAELSTPVASQVLLGHETGQTMGVVKKTLVRDTYIPSR